MQSDLRKGRSRHRWSTSRAESQPPRGTDCRSARRCLARRCESLLLRREANGLAVGSRRQLAAACRPTAARPASPPPPTRPSQPVHSHVSPDLPRSPQISPDLPRSPHMSASSHASISPYLPISRASSSASPLSRSISPYLPISAHISRLELRQPSSEQAYRRVENPSTHAARTSNHLQRPSREQASIDSSRHPPRQRRHPQPQRPQSPRRLRRLRRRALRSSRRRHRRRRVSHLREAAGRVLS